MDTLSAYPYKNDRRINTYSIIAIDKKAGLMGGAVQSHFFSVGGTVLWGEAGTGILCTQALANLQFGPAGLELLRRDVEPSKILEELLESDAGREHRQVAILTTTGIATAYTGKSCIREAGHVIGEAFSAQANMMLRPTVWQAMADSFRSTNGRLEDRLVEALESAEKEGGDIRGRQSAHIVTYALKPTGRVSSDNPLDLRVEDHPEPLREMKRLLELHRAYEHMNQGDHALDSRDYKTAFEAYRKARELAPANPEMQFWHGVALFNTGRLQEGVNVLEALLGERPQWKELLFRLTESGLLQISKEKLADLFSN